jgi:hypothetical protein
MSLEENALTELRAYAEMIHCRSLSGMCNASPMRGSAMDAVVEFALCEVSNSLAHTHVQMTT